MNAQSTEISISSVLSPYFIVFLAAWFVTIVTTPLMRMLAVRFGVVDLPDKDRKNHLEPVAYLGGVAIFLGWMAGIVGCWWVTPHLPERLEIQHVQFPVTIIIGAVIITVVGVIDDVYGIVPRVKLGGQLFAAAMIAQTHLGEAFVRTTLRVLQIHDPHLFMGYHLSYVLGAAVIALMVLGACNAVNLLDGLDGLVTGVLAISCVGFLIISVHVAINISGTGGGAMRAQYLTDPVRIVMCLAMLGALLGFLPHNFNPANIFMGDAGSLLLGYLCATTILLFAHASKHGPMLVTAAMIVFALPITDTALAIFRRIIARQPIFRGDDRHLHHQFVRSFEQLGCGSSLSIKLAVASMYVLALIFAALGCALVYVRWRFVIGVFVVIFGFVIVMGYKSARKQLMMIRAEQGVARDETPSAAPAPPPDDVVGPAQDPQATGH
ncbi:MAG: hypothetical protein CMJ18_20410 [Phycisphaeraceae bacterium]|nr:hypothetical protein [Phycisphaeraceae bacterium]